MGLDIVEMVLTTEERFGINIPDEDAAKLVTVGDLEDYVLRKLEATRTKTGDATGCMSAHVFYRLRAQLQQSLGHHRNAITPASPLEALLPKEDRHPFWHQCKQTLGWTLPELERSSWVTSVLTATFFVPLGGAFLLTVLSVLSSPQGWGLAASGIALCIVLSSATRPLAVHLPKKIQTFGAMCEVVVSLNFDAITAARNMWTESEAISTLRHIISEQIGIDVGRITREACFVDDLGMG